MVEIKFNLTGKEQPAKVAQVLALIYALDPSTNIDATTSEKKLQNDTAEEVTTPKRNDAGDVVTNDPGNKVEKAPAKTRKRRTQAEIKAEKEAAAKAAESEEETDPFADGEDESEDSDIDSDLDDLLGGGDESEDSDELDTTDPDHMEKLSALIREVCKNPAKKSKANEILNNKYKTDSLKVLSDTKKKGFYADLKALL